MNSGKNGYDYTPLFKFLLSRVGSDWDQTYSEAKARLNDPKPIFWMVALHKSEQQNFVRTGESTYYSGLFVNDDGKLAVVNLNVKFSDLPVPYAGETISFNGLTIDQTENHIQKTNIDNAAGNNH